MILTYADLLAKKGHEVKVIVQSRRWTRHIFNLLGIKPSWFRNLSAKVLRVNEFSEIAIPDADILVMDSWKVVQVASRLSDKKGSRFHFVQHDERLYHGPAGEVDEVYRLPIKKVVVSSWLKEVFARDYHIETELLLNTVDRDLFHPVAIAKDNLIIKILLLHHPYTWKGTEEGIALVQKLKERYPNIKLILFGARNEKIDLSCDEYYYNLPQEKLAWLYSSCDIFLCPSWDEGFGLPSLEAMACKCAVVTYDNGGSRDYAFDPHTSRGVGIDGQTALVAKRRDLEDLYNKLKLAVRDENLRKNIAENGYNFVTNMPTWQEQAEKLERMLSKQ